MADWFYILPFDTGDWGTLADPRRMCEPRIAISIGKADLHQKLSYAFLISCLGSTGRLQSMYLLRLTCQLKLRLTGKGESKACFLQGRSPRNL